MAMLLLGVVAQAQERETVYVTFTSKVSGETEGVIKSYPKQRETHLSEPMAFRVRSQLKNYMFYFGIFTATIENKFSARCTNVFGT